MISLHLSQQLQWIRIVQEMRNPILDCFFYFMNFFDTKYLILVLLPLIFVGWNWKHGFRILMLLFISCISVFFLKDLFNVPRPYVIDPSVGMIHIPGQSFPSGAAQTSIILPGFFIYFYRKRWVVISAIIFALVLSFSRIYLGVHYPIDILGGWLVGAVLLFAYILWGKRIEKFLSKRSYPQLLLISLIFPLLFILLFPYPYVLSNSCAVMGVGVGLVISRHRKWLLSQPVTKAEFFVRFVFSMSILLILYVPFLLIEQIASLALIARILQALLLGFWLSLGSFYCLKRWMKY